MTATELLATLAQRGVRLSIEANRLRVDAAKGVLAPELRKALAAHKKALIEVLTANPLLLFELGRTLFGGVEVSASANGACAICGGRRWWRSIHGALVCMRCHPPAAAELAAGTAEVQA